MIKKAKINKAIKFTALGVLIFLVSVIALSYVKSNGGARQGKSVESVISEEMHEDRQAMEEGALHEGAYKDQHKMEVKTSHGGMGMEEDREREPSRGTQGLARVHIDPRKQQLIGVKTGEVAKRKLLKNIRTVGVIEADERKIARVSIKFRGWVKDVFVDYVGKYVGRGEPLFNVYSPEVVATVEEYLLALGAEDSFGKSSFPEISSSAKSLIAATRRRLLLWDISEREIERIEKTGKPIKYLTLYSPISGYVTKREAFPEKMVMPNDVVFEIVDLSTVWLFADIYEYELPLVKVGQEAIITLSYYPKEVFHGKVTYVYPTVETRTRTVKVRFEFENEGMKLKPGMYTNVEIKIPLEEALTVTEDSVIDTGERKIVFVAMGDGYFEPRNVRVGQRAEGYYEVLDGLREGEIVVRSAVFLIDSESRLKGAIEAYVAGTEPVSQAPIAAPKEIDISFSTDGGISRVGNNAFKIGLRDMEGNPITDAEVKVVFHMPPMQSMGMPAMTISSAGKHKKDGLYIVKIKLSMSGSWQVKVIASRPGKPSASSFFEINVR